MIRNVVLGFIRDTQREKTTIHKTSSKRCSAESGRIVWGTFDRDRLAKFTHAQTATL